MAKKILSLVLALAMISSFACISAFAQAAPKVYNGGTATLNLKGAFEADGEDGAIWAKNGAMLTINGTDADTVKALYVTKYTIAVWALGQGTEVVINGGYYTNEGDPDNAEQADLIYAKDGANIVINGGTFKCATPKWTLNSHDTLKGTITVNGGKFYKFDPSKAETGDNEIILGDGCEVVQKGDWYQVVRAPEVYEAGEKATLNLKGAFEADGEDGAIWAKDGAELTIEGTDKDIVKAVYVTEYTIAVWALGQDTEVVINGGYYTNEGDPNNAQQADLIYAKAGANIVINGGTFKCATPQWTLNCHDTQVATITVNGGKFYQFDPSNANENVAPAGGKEILLGEGCKVIKNGDWYEVVKNEEANIEFNSASGAVDGEKGALRFVFNVEIPAKTKTYFGAYLLPLDIFKASGVANAVQVQYDTDVETNSTFSADLVEIPQNYFETSIYAIPYIKTTNGVVTFTGKSASVKSAATSAE